MSVKLRDALLLGERERERDAAKEETEVPCS